MSEDSCQQTSTRRAVPTTHAASGNRTSVPASGGVLPSSASDLLPSRLASRIEEIVESPSDDPGKKLLQVAGALPDLAGVALAPRFAGEVCTIMGGIEGISRSSAGTAVGILIAPILAVSKIARLMGVEFTPQAILFRSRYAKSGTDIGDALPPTLRKSLGLSEPDHYHSPATAAARLDSLELKMVKPPSTKHEDGAADTQYNETNDGIMCAVCQCDFEEGEYGLVFRHCKHAFHAKCINTWLDRRHTCPCCRESVSPDASSVKGRRRFDSVRYAFRSGEGRRGSAPAAAGAAPVSVMFGGGGSGEERRGRGRRDVETSPLEADGDVVEPSQEMEMGDVVDVASDVDDSLYEEAASGRFIFF